MSNYVKRTDKMDIYIEPSRKTIVVRQRWKYDWTSDMGLPQWTYREKKEWHDKADNIIWNTWGRNYVALVFSDEASGPIKDLHLKDFTVEFDIEWVLHNEHWEVQVSKVPAEDDFPSRVDVENNIVYVAAYDVNNTVVSSSKPDISFNVFNHEYGHTLYPTDDYGVAYGNDFDGPYSSDFRGLMTIGNEFRTRYVRDLRQTINTVIPNVRFSILVKNI